MIALLVNAGIFYAVSYNLVEEMYGRERVAIVTVSLAAFYTAHVFYFLRRRLVDRELLVSFTGLAAFFLAVTMPLLLGVTREWITISWAIQAFVLLWIAGKIGSEFLRHVSYVFMPSCCTVSGSRSDPRILGPPAAVNLPLTQLPPTARRAARDVRRADRFDRRRIRLYASAAGAKETDCRERENDISPAGSAGRG